MILFKTDVDRYCLLTYIWAMQLPADVPPPSPVVKVYFHNLAGDGNRSGPATNTPPIPMAGKK